jgi:hypothetical protein
LRLLSEHPELRQSLTLVRIKAESLEDLTGLRAGLEQQPLRLSEVDVRRLPAPLRGPVRSLQSIEGLRLQISKRWGATPDRAALERDLKGLGAATGDHLARRVRCFLAMKAQAEGHPELARQLRPTSKLEDVPSILRDMKTFVLGDGPGGGDAGPPGPRLPAPEPPAKGPRPRAAGSILDGLPSLKETRQGVPSLKETMASTAKQVRESVQKQVTNYVFFYRQQLHFSLQRLPQYAWQISAGAAYDGDRIPDKDEPEGDAAVADVAKALGRRLTPAERVLVPVMKKRGEKAQEIVRILGDLEGKAVRR